MKHVRDRLTKKQKEERERARERAGEGIDPPLVHMLGDLGGPDPYMGTAKK